MSVRERLNGAYRTAALHTLLAVERVRTGVAYNPLDPRNYADPYPVYRRLRERDPWHRSMLTSGWVLTRHADVLAVLRDPRFSLDARKAPGYERRRRRLVRSGAVPAEEPTPSLLGLDPPDHTRLRSLVSRAFTPRAVSQLEPRIEKIVSELLDEALADGGGRIDVIEALAYPVPVIVIAELLGVPPEDRATFRRLSNEAARTVGGPTTSDDVRRSRLAGEELTEYFRCVAEERRREPRDDLLSGLLQAEEEGDRLTLDEVFSTCILLLVAGNETTTNLIGNGLLALLRHPEQLELLRGSPSLMENAVEELLRYDSPVQATARRPLEDLEIDGHRFRSKDQVVLLLGAANRDPEKFPDPERLDVTREDTQHVSFGHGVHFCLGSSLARLEARVALSGLLARTRELRLADENLRWRDNLVLHGLESLVVDVRGAT